MSLLEHNTKHRCDRGGFTLVELLVVIMVLGLLATIIVPSVARVRTNTMRSQSKMMVTMIDTGLRMYFDDHKQYPEPAAIKGRIVVAMALTGYGAKADDGEDGLGFRISDGAGGWEKTLYVPYNDTQKLLQDEVVGGVKTGKKIGPFLDAFDNPILYYRYDTVTKTYKASDNDDLTAKPSVPSYMQKGAAFYRTDFVLCTAGSDGVFSSTGSSDDVLNFTRE